MNAENEHSNRQACPESSEATCSVTPDSLIVAFVQGAQWWEWHKTNATIRECDRNLAEHVAALKAKNGNLGKSPNDKSSATPEQRRDPRQRN